MADRGARGRTGRGGSPLRPDPPDLGRRLVDPGPLVPAQPAVTELTDALRDRTGRLRLRDRPPIRVRPGTLVGAVTVSARELTALLRSASEEERPIWSRAGSEILVAADAVTATTVDGGIVVTVPVETEQTKRVDIQVPLALGTEAGDAGLLASTSSRPLGPAVIVERWGEALVAHVWRALLQVAVAVAARAGSDERGDPLVPASLRAGDGGLTVVPIARHRKVV